MENEISLKPVRFEELVPGQVYRDDPNNDLKLRYIGSDEDSNGIYLIFEYVSGQNPFILSPEGMIEYYLLWSFDYAYEEV